MSLCRLDNLKREKRIATLLWAHFHIIRFTTDSNNFIRNPIASIKKMNEKFQVLAITMPSQPKKLRLLLFEYSLLIHYESRKTQKGCGFQIYSDQTSKLIGLLVYIFHKLPDIHFTRVILFVPTYSLN